MKNHTRKWNTTSTYSTTTTTERGLWGLGRIQQLGVLILRRRVRLFLLNGE